MLCKLHDCIAIVNPLIMGETTVTMGDTVSLYCNASHSRPPATVQWLSPGGEVVSDGGVSTSPGNWKGSTRVFPLLSTPVSPRTALCKLPLDAVRNFLHNILY